jgi:uridine phosphorylase
VSEGEVLPNAETRVESPRDRRIAIPEGERQYHIGLGPGDLAEYILLPGDPDRTARIATRLDSIELEHQHREFATVTGTFRGQRVSVVSTGIGTDNVEIVVAEILAITERPTFIRVGSCGALQPEMNLGDLAITTGAVRLESTTSFFVHDGYPAVADYEAVAALIEAAERLGHRYHVGVTATAPGFFGAQGRPIPQLPIRYPDLAEDMARQRVMNFEMEASALLVLASLARCRAGVVCAVYANRTTGEFVEGANKDAAEAACVDTGLESLLVLAEMDAQKRAASTDRWRPSLWASETARTR